MTFTQALKLLCKGKKMYRDCWRSDRLAYGAFLQLRDDQPRKDGYNWKHKCSKRRIVLWKGYPTLAFVNYILEEDDILASDWSEDIRDYAIIKEMALVEAMEKVRRYNRAISLE